MCVLLPIDYGCLRVGVLHASMYGNHEQPNNQKRKTRELDLEEGGRRRRVGEEEEGRGRRFLKRIDLDSGQIVRHRLRGIRKGRMEMQNKGILIRHTEVERNAYMKPETINHSQVFVVELVECNQQLLKRRKSAIYS